MESEARDTASTASPLSDAAFIAAVNHLLKTAAWARQRLSQRAGKTVAVALGPLGVVFALDANGYLTQAAHAQPPDATLTVAPDALLRQAAGETADASRIETAGDTALALEIAHLLRQLRWDVEEDLSQVVGDVLAHRLAGLGAGVLGWPQRAARSLGQSLAEYWTEEQPTLARREAALLFLTEVDYLRDAVERLEKRVARLAARPISPSGGV